MDDKLELQERTTAPAGWWEGKFCEQPGKLPVSVVPASWLVPSWPNTILNQDDLHELAIANAWPGSEDELTDPVDAYTARYAFCSGEWDHKIYTFEGQTREEAIKLCRSMFSLDW